MKCNAADVGISGCQNLEGIDDGPHINLLQLSDEALSPTHYINKDGDGAL